MWVPVAMEWHGEVPGACMVTRQAVMTLSSWIALGEQD